MVSSAHFVVLVPSSYRVHAVFLLYIMYRRPADILQLPILAAANPQAMPVGRPCPTIE